MEMELKGQNEPEYDAIFEALLTKTREGKLEWHETADENTFLAAMRGVRTFQVSADYGAGRIQLVVKDEVGNVYLSTPFLQAEQARELYELARRLALHVDERVENTVELPEPTLTEAVRASWATPQLSRPQLVAFTAYHPVAA